MLLSSIQILLLIGTASAQLDGGYMEIYTWSSGSSQDSIRFWMEAVGPIWDTPLTPPDTQRVIDEHNVAYGTRYASLKKRGVPIPNTSWNYGLHHVNTLVPADSLQYGFGLYKLSVGFDYDTPLIYFYLNWTDCDYALGYSKNDTWMRFNNSDTTIDISWDDSIFNDPTVVEQGDHQTFEIWEYKARSQGYSGQNTDCFELYLSISIQNDHPYLTWNAYDGRSGNNALDYYEVWKKGTGSWSLKDTTSNAYYEDLSESCSRPGVKGYVHYKIRAVELDDDESPFGNEERKVIYDNSSQDSKIDPSSEKSTFINPTVNSLKQNYPNPFNPTTTISFDLRKESTVHFEIFNVQGKIVSTLVNGTMDQGNHNVRFNSSGLPSGVYFYRLQTQEFTDIKRMLLLK